MYSPGWELALWIKSFLSPNIHWTVNTFLILLSVPKWECILRIRFQNCIQDFIDRYSFWLSPSICLWFAFYYDARFSKCHSKKGEGWSRGRSLCSHHESQCSLSSSGDKSMLHVSGNIAAFHSDLNLDKLKHFLKSHHWDQLMDSLVLLTRAVPQAILHVSFIGFIRGAAGLLLCPWICFSRHQELSVFRLWFAWMCWGWSSLHFSWPLHSKQHLHP